MFASQVTKAVQVGDVEVVIRKLSGRSLDKARDAKQIASATQIRAFGGDVLKALRDDTVTLAVESLRSKAEDAEAKRKAIYASVDRDTVLTQGIVSWNASRKLTPEAIADLDEDSANALHEAIMDLSLPPKDVVEAIEGNV